MRGAHAPVACPRSRVRRAGSLLRTELVRRATARGRHPAALGKPHKTAGTGEVSPGRPRAVPVSGRQNQPGSGLRDGRAPAARPAVRAQPHPPCPSPPRSQGLAGHRPPPGSGLRNGHAPAGLHGLLAGRDRGRVRPAGRRALRPCRRPRRAGRPVVRGGARRLLIVAGHQSSVDLPQQLRADAAAPPRAARVVAQAAGAGAWCGGGIPAPRDLRRRTRHEQLRGGGPRTGRSPHPPWGGSSSPSDRPGATTRRPRTPIPAYST